MEQNLFQRSLLATAGGPIKAWQSQTFKRENFNWSHNDWLTLHNTKVVNEFDELCFSLQLTFRILLLYSSGKETPLKLIHENSKKFCRYPFIYVFMYKVLLIVVSVNQMLFQLKSRINSNTSIKYHWSFS